MIRPIRTLDLNTQGLYQANRTPCSELQATNTNSLSPESTESTPAKPIQTLITFDIPTETENFNTGFLNSQSPERSISFLDFSKYLIHRLSRNGVIEPIPLHGVIYPQEISDFDDQGRKEINPRQCLVNGLIPTEFLAGDEKQYTNKEAATAILQGRFGSELVIKPEANAFASGLMMLKFQDSNLEIKIIDPGLHDKFFRASHELMKHCQREGFEEIPQQGRTKVFRLDLSDRRRAQTQIESLITIALQETANPRFVTKHRDTVQIHCGLIEPKLDLVTNKDNNALEARYFCTVNPDGSFIRSQGYYESKGKVPILCHSFMKGGKSGDFVNCGELLGTDDETLKPLIEATGLQGYSQDYQDYIYNLLEAQSKHIRAQALQAGILKSYEPICFVFDIAWRKNDFMTIPKANGHGVIKVPRPVQTEALLQLPLTDEYIAQSQRSKQIDLAAIYNRDKQVLMDIIDHSKFFHRLIAQGGPIDLTENLALLHPYKPEDFDQNGWQRLTEKTPHDTDHHYYVYNQMLPTEITQLANNKLASEFVDDFLAGKYPDKVVIKPDISCFGDGQIRLSKGDGKVIIKIVDLSQDVGFHGGRSLYADIVADRGEVIKENSQDGTTTYTISTEDKPTAAQALTDILRASFSKSYDRFQQSIFGPMETGVPDYAQNHLRQIVDSGHAEREENLLKIDGHVVEGRYFLGPSGGGGVALSQGLRRVGDFEQDFSPSFMKVGQGPIVVNRGAGGKAWPDMHDELIKSNGLNLDKDEFNLYMRNLVFEEAKHIYTRLKEQGIPIDSISIDVAWDANERIEVPTSTGGTMLVPRPILMEWNFFNR